MRNSLQYPMTSRGGHIRRAPGFTIVELLVVITVIVALIAILIPTISKAHNNALKTSATVQLGAIRTGLQQYFDEFGMYPPSSPTYGGIAANRGDVMLTQGLMGFLPGSVDGAGPDLQDPLYGFRPRRNNVAMGQGKVFGPYVPADKSFRPLAPPTTPAQYQFVDSFGRAILYFRSTRSPQATVTPIATSPTVIFSTGTPGNYYFEAADCSGVPGITNPAFAPGAFFNLISAGNSNTVAGAVTGSGGFLLISGGQDETYFTADDIILGN